MSVAAALAIATGDAPVVPIGIEHALGLQLPEAFWSARSRLEHVRQAARSRRVAPDAVLAGLLVRVAACTPHTVELPATVGTACGLTLYAAPIGGPSSGKSSAVAVAAELLPAPPEVLDRLPVGSGEGWVEILFDWVEETSDNGKTVMVKEQKHNAAIFAIDEGRALAELGGRRGATLLETFRTAFTHGTLGQTNASKERRRIVDGRSYVFGVTIALQPDLAGPLLADDAAGTPQRIVWFSAEDPASPDVRPAWPGELRWKPPTAKALQAHATQRGGWLRHQLGVDPAIVAELDAERLAIIRGEVEVDRADAHRGLVQLKVAAVLALLDERLDVNGEDWRLAEIVVSTSRRIRLDVERTIALVEATKRAVSDRRHVERAVATDESLERSRTRRCAATIARRVHSHAADRKHEQQGGGCTARCCSQALSSKQREALDDVGQDIDDALDHAESQGWIERSDGRIRPGESRPL